MDWTSKHAVFVQAAYVLSFMVLALIAGRILIQKRRLEAELEKVAKRDDRP